MAKVQSVATMAVNISADTTRASINVDIIRENTAASISASTINKILNSTLQTKNKVL